ncbi:hypothetical protein BTM352_16100 [Helicobacter pylori]
MDFRILNTKFLLLKHYAFKIGLCEKLKEADSLSQLQGKSVRTF